jgi:hypothetical protein
MIGMGGLWMHTLNCFNRMKSLIELEEAFLVLLPERESIKLDLFIKKRIF